MAIGWLFGRVQKKNLYHVGAAAPRFSGGLTRFSAVGRHADHLDNRPYDHKAQHIAGGIARSFGCALRTRRNVQWKLVVDGTKTYRTTNLGVGYMRRDPLNPFRRIVGQQDDIQSFLVD